MWRKYPKGTDFTNITEEELNAGVNDINNIFRLSINYWTVNEIYDECNQKLISKNFGLYFTLYKIN
ncbi:MAG: hypothetical protein LBP70_03785 [Mycoplasmataceae bacterium]|jgi:IS30 family transposase|nr:hypothetical protein [Mycoplasmataceae bacterium]